MKTAFLSLIASSLLATAALAAPSPVRVSGPGQQAPHDRLNDRNDRDFNYGFDKKHKVTPEERKRWEEAHKNDRKADHQGARPDDRRNDRNDRDFNYGFDKNHKVTPQERARWEEAHRNAPR